MPTKSNCFKLTASSVKQRCHPPREGEVTSTGKPVPFKLYWDTEEKGFCLAVGKRLRTFFVQRDLHGRTVRAKIGRLGTWTVDQARKAARKLIVEMDQGINPNLRKREQCARGVRLREAIEMHAKAMAAKDCAKSSIQSIQEELERHLGDWLDRPLAELTKNECAKRHLRLTEEAGPIAANRALMHLRACYNTAARRMDLPLNPTSAVVFNRVPRRRNPIPWAELPAWRAKVDALTNAIRRDYQLVMLFTGLRATDAATIRWEHVDFDKGTLHRPKPKGGVDRAFTIPLARVVLDLLRARREDNKVLYRDEGWVFVTHGRRGGVTHIKQKRELGYVNGKKRSVLPSPHRLRYTFITAAHEAGVHGMDIKVLVNHSLGWSGDVTEGYIRPSVEHLRGAVEKVAALLVERMRGEPKREAG